MLEGRGLLLLALSGCAERLTCLNALVSIVLTDAPIGRADELSGDWTRTTIPIPGFRLSNGSEAHPHSALGFDRMPEMRRSPLRVRQAERLSIFS